MRHLLDSDVLIWVLRGKTAAVDFVTQLLKNEAPFISSLAVYEIWSGAKKNEETAIDEFLSAFPVLAVTPEIARQGASYYREFRTRGVTISVADALIAATARVHQLVLVSQNQRDFPMTDIEKRSLP